MRFAYVGTDLFCDAFDVFVRAGWQPLKLFTHTCDRLINHNERILEHAERHKLPIQLSRLGVADLAALRDAGCDALIVGGYRWRIPAWEDHLTYAVNLHPSLLPEARGPYPIYRAILDGATAWGTTAHALARDFDAGPILAQERFAVAPDETHDTLLARCQLAARRISARLAAGLPELWRDARPQGAGSYWPLPAWSARTIDWSAGVADALRLVRAFGSVEAVADLGASRIYVRAAHGWTEPHDHPPGAIVHAYGRHVVVAVRDGFIQLVAWSPVSREDCIHMGRGG